MLVEDAAQIIDSITLARGSSSSLLVARRAIANSLTVAAQ
jgi:hypothetical protein